MAIRSIHTDAPTELIIAAAQSAGEPVERLCVGLTWTSCRTRNGMGLAMSPGFATRTLPWPGSVAGRPLADVAGWLRSLDPYESTVGMAAANAHINRPDNALMREAEPISGEAPGNLHVFEHFRPKLQGRKVVVIGRYPGLDKVLDGLEFTVLERMPTGDDLPDNAAEFVLPEADWVFITAMTLINKSFERLARLARDSVTVLMGPSMPWLQAWSAHGVDYLAGVRLVDADRAEQIAMEGGGTRLFEDGVQYAVLDIGRPRMQAVKDEIADVFAQRQQLKSTMALWYDTNKGGRFPGMAELDRIDARLSRLDACYKRLWDARN